MKKIVNINKNEKSYLIIYYFFMFFLLVVVSNTYSTKLVSRKPFDKGFKYLKNQRFKKYYNRVAQFNNFINSIKMESNKEDVYNFSCHKLLNNLKEEYENIYTDLSFWYLPRFENSQQKLSIYKILYYMSDLDLNLSKKDFLNKSIFTKVIKKYNKCPFLFYTSNKYEYINCNLKTKDFKEYLIELSNCKYDNIVDYHNNDSNNINKIINRLSDIYSFFNYVMIKSMVEKQPKSVLYRAVSLSADNSLININNIGKKTIAIAPLSSTLSLEVAQDFLVHKNSGENRLVMLKIENKSKDKSIRGIYLGREFSNFDYEFEFLIRPFSVFEITNIEKDKIFENNKINYYYDEVTLTYVKRENITCFKNNEEYLAL